MGKNKENAIYEVKFINEKLERMEKPFRVQLVEQGSCYTYHIGVALNVPVGIKTSWYEISNKTCFKNWAECYAFVNGYRSAMIENFGY